MLRERKDFSTSILETSMSIRRVFVRSGNIGIEETDWVNTDVNWDGSAPAMYKDRFHKESRV